MELRHEHGGIIIENKIYNTTFLLILRKLDQT